MNGTDDAQEYPLADILSELADQLEEANQRVVQVGRLGRLRWTEATVELGVTWEKAGDGEVDLKVIRLGGSITKANTTTVTVTAVPSDLRSPSQNDVAAQAQPARKDPSPN